MRGVFKCLSVWVYRLGSRVLQAAAALSNALTHLHTYTIPYGFFSAIFAPSTKSRDTELMQ